MSQSEIDEILMNLWTVDAYKVPYTNVIPEAKAQINSLITEARIDELEQLEFIDWESYKGEKVKYDSGVNELVDMYIESYAKDRLKQLRKDKE